jgi:hypothetical protein
MLQGPSMRILLLSLLLLSGLSHSQDLQDVIYKKDGSVLRGVLIEQDFNSGRYKIQLNGGSVFSIEKADIEKITKEAPLNGAANNGAININIENNPNINQNPSTEVHASAVANNAPVQDETFKHVLFIGTMGHGLTASSVYGNSIISYSGFNIGGQLNFNKHLALYADYNRGKLKEIILQPNFGPEETVTEGLADETYSALQVAAILSTNLYQGWQFFTGLGISKEGYKENDTNESMDFTSTGVQFGLGYSWRTLQTMLRVNILSDSDYPEHLTDAATVNLQVGFNF